MGGRSEQRSKRRGARYFFGACFIGFGSGLFAVSTLTMAMCMPVQDIVGRGLALGSWGAAQATAAGLGVAIGAVLKDFVGKLAMDGSLGVGLINPAIGYIFVYHLEILFIFITLAVLGPLAQQINRINRSTKNKNGSFGLSEMPV